MTCKKILLIAIITSFSIVNVYVARFAFQPEDDRSKTRSDDTKRTTSATLKLPKAPKTLIMHVNDVHPITHLQEAARILQDQQQNASIKKGHVILNPEKNIGFQQFKEDMAVLRDFPNDKTFVSPSQHMQNDLVGNHQLSQFQPQNQEQFLFKYDTPNGAGHGSSSSYNVHTDLKEGEFHNSMRDGIGKVPILNKQLHSFTSIQNGQANIILNALRSKFHGDFLTNDNANNGILDSVVENKIPQMAPKQLYNNGNRY